MTRFRLPSLGKLEAIADVTAVLPSLTGTELRRLLALAHGLRRERTGRAVTATLPEEALPVVEAAALAVDRLEHLYAASIALFQIREFLASESRASVLAGEKALDEVIAALDALKPERVRTLAAALRAAGDPPT